MRRTTLATVAVLVATHAAIAEAPPDEVVQRLTKAIRTHCPEAKVEMTDQELLAKFGTMTFTLHRRSKSGEVSPNTYQEEGPNFKGFMLRLALNEGKYQGAAVVPQTLQGPYFPTFIDAPAVEAKDKHFFVRFSYGSRIDPELKKAIFEAMPTTTFKQGTTPDRGGK